MIEGQTRSSRHIWSGQLLVFLHTLVAVGFAQDQTRKDFGDELFLVLPCVPADLIAVGRLSDYDRIGVPVSIARAALVQNVTNFVDAGDGRLVETVDLKGGKGVRSASL